MALKFEFSRRKWFRMILAAFAAAPAVPAVEKGIAGVGKYLNPLNGDFPITPEEAFQSTPSVLFSWNKITALQLEKLKLLERPAVFQILDPNSDVFVYTKTERKP